MPGWVEAFPQQFAGILAFLPGMLIGSLAPQWIENHRGHVHQYLGVPEGQV